MRIMKKVKNLKFESAKDPEVIKVINELADLEQRRSHDTARRLLLTAGTKRISELKKERSSTQPT